MSYIDGFVFSVAKKNKQKYLKMAREGRDVWKKFGALDYKECRMDNVKLPWVTFTFPKMAKAKPGEEVWFSFIVYKNKKHAEDVTKKAMAHFAKKYPGKMPDMPFDMKRFASGRFVTEVE